MLFGPRSSLLLTQLAFIFAIKEVLVLILYKDGISLRPVRVHLLYLLISLSVIKTKVFIRQRILAQPREYFRLISIVTHQCRFHWLILHSAQASSASLS